MKQSIPSYRELSVVPSMAQGNLCAYRVKFHNGTEEDSGSNLYLPGRYIRMRDSKNPSHKQLPIKGAQGFSLVELLTVIAVIAVVVGVIVPDLSSFKRTYNIRNDADRLVTLVNLARMRSVSTFSRVEVTCSSSTNQCTLQSKAYGASSWVADANKQTITLSSGVSFGVPASVSLGAGGQSQVAPYQGSKAQSISYSMIFSSRGLPIVDNSTGTAVSDYAFYLLGPNNKSMAISADASGQTSLYNLNGSSWQLATD